jgi:hypothetical protein
MFRAAKAAAIVGWRLLCDPVKSAAECARPIESDTAKRRRRRKAKRESHRDVLLGKEQMA